MLFNNIEEVAAFSSNLLAAIKAYIDNKPEVTFKSVFSEAVSIVLYTLE